MPPWGWLKKNNGSYTSCGILILSFVGVCSVVCPCFLNEHGRGGGSLRFIFFLFFSLRNPFILYTKCTRGCYNRQEDSSSSFFWRERGEGERVNTVEYLWWGLIVFPFSISCPFAVFKFLAYSSHLVVNAQESK